VAARSPDADDKRDADPPDRAGGAIVIGSLTMASRVLGLVRDILFASLFFGRALDAFVLAFTVPNLFRRLFGEGVLSGALVPVLVKKIDKGDREGAARLAARVLGAVVLGLGAVALAVSAVGVVVALAAGTASRTGLVAGVLAVVMPYVVPICAAAVVMAFLNAHGRFAPSAVSPVLLNIALITAALLRPTVWSLAVAVLVGGALQFAVQLIAARRLGMPARPEVEFADPDLHRVGRALLPTVVGFAVFQINVLLDRLIAWVLIPGDGAVGSLFLGNRLMQLPLAVFAIAIATAALPGLSSHAASKEGDGFRSALRAGTRSILFWTVPAGIGLALLAEPLTALLFRRGSFLAAPGALEKTSLVVMFYAPGLVAFGLATLYSRALYARGQQRLVVRAALAAVCVNVVLNVALVLVFQRVALAPTVGAAVASGEAGLALASSASGFAYLAMLATFLARGKGAARSGAALAGGAILAGGAAAFVTAALLATDTAGSGWDWLWLAPRLPVIVSAGGLAAAWIAIAAPDPELGPPFWRIALTATLMGVFTNLVLSSLPRAGPSWSFAAQRAIAPVLLGAGAYWFLAGFIAGPEYDQARDALARALGRSRPKDAANERAA
jgi:putative peptidoglycan lipid II flippase